MKNKIMPMWLNGYPDLMSLWHAGGTMAVNALRRSDITTRKGIESNILVLHKVPGLGPVSFRLIVKHFNLDYTNDKLEHEFIKSIKFLEKNGFKVNRI